LFIINLEVPDMEPPGLSIDIFSLLTVDHMLVSLATALVAT